MKHCNKCDKDLSLDQFYKNKSSKDGFAFWCKSCMKEYNQQYRQTENGKKVHKKCHKNYRYSEKGQIVFKKADKNRTINGKNAQYRKNRNQTDINFKIKNYLRNRIWEVLKKRKTIRSQHTLELLGCSLELLKQHLESQFQEGMTFENYGEWHIDHYIPCFYFDLSDPLNQRICFNYRNLQPLWERENIKKSHKIPENVLELIAEIKSCLE